MNGAAALFLTALILLWSAGIWHALLAARCARAWQAGLLPEAKSPPLTLLRPIKAGMPDLRAKLAELARAMRAEDRLVLGVNAGTPDVETAEAVRAEFAERDIVVVPCVAGAALNPKISKLVQMESAARSGHLLLSDAEMVFDRHWLEAFRREWAASGADAMTCGYRFSGGESWPQTLDAAPALFSLWPGVLFVRRFGRMKFTLGACTGLHHRDLTSVGGWARFGDELAEDNRLGAALAQAKKSIRLSQQVATLTSDPVSWREYWRHQRRVAVTYRIANPAGFAGMIFTHSLALSLILIALSPLPRSSLFAGCAVAQIVRWIYYAALAGATGFSRARLLPALLISDLTGAVCWLLAWISPHVWWAGKWWRVSPGGKLRES